LGRNWNRDNGAAYDKIFESTLIGVAACQTGANAQRMNSLISEYTIRLPWQRRYGKHLQQMTDKGRSGGIIWSRVV